MTTKGETKPADFGEMLTVEEAAKRLGQSVRQVRRLVAERRIVFHKFGRSVRISTLDIAGYVAACRVETITDSDVWRDLNGRAA